MKLPRFLSIACLITLISLLYVWQQTEIFRLAYVGIKNEGAFQDLLDKNTILRYNFKQAASLVRIGNRISESADFQMPDGYRLVRLTLPEEIKITTSTSNTKQNIVARLFGIKRQAEAKTINP